MRFVTLCLAFFMLTAGCDLADPALGFSMENDTRNSSAAPQLDYVFDLADLPRVEVVVSIEEWNTLLTNYDTFYGNEQDVMADFVFEKQGVTVTNQSIGLRIRGNTSRRRPEGNYGDLHGQSGLYRSAHFRISFDSYDAEGRFYGLRSLVLKWFKDDPSYSREIYSYDLFRRFGVHIAPRSSYTRLYIRFKETGEEVFYGVYQMVEAVDKSYLKAHFPGNNKGHLWKCSAGSSLELSTADQMGLETDSLTTKSTPVYDLKTKKSGFSSTARPQLEAFIQDLNNLTPGTPALALWLSQNLEVDLFLRTMAVTVLLGSWDSYWNGGNNYYLYFDEAGKATFIPYDFDNSLGTGLSGFGDPGEKDVRNWASRSLPLADQVLSIPEYYTRYTNYLYQLVSGPGLFDIVSSTNRIQAWQQAIAPWVGLAEVVAEGKNNYNSIGDLPAQTWGDYRYYRLYSETAEGDPRNAPGANYFLSRTLSAVQQLGLEQPDWYKTEFLSQYEQIYIRGSFSSWSAGRAMQLVADHTWQIVLSGCSGMTEFKFVSHATDWGQLNWGDPEQDGVGNAWSSVNMRTLLTGEVVIRFHELSLEYSAAY